MTCPSSETLTLPFGTTSVVYNWSTPVASDNVAITGSALFLALEPVDRHLNQATFLRGSTIMLYTVTDYGKNSASCTWVVQVIELGQVDTQVSYRLICLLSLSVYVVCLSMLTRRSLVFLSVCFLCLLSLSVCVVYLSIFV